MDEFFTWKYIVGVLVASVLVNIFTHYLIPPLDRVFASIFSQWRTRSEKSKRAYEDSIDKYERDPLLVLLLVQNTISVGIVSWSCMMAAVIVLVIGSSVTLADGEIFNSVRHIKMLSALFLFLGMGFYFVSAGKVSIFRDLRKRRFAVGKNVSL